MQRQLIIVIQQKHRWTHRERKRGEGGNLNNWGCRINRCSLEPWRPIWDKGIGVAVAGDVFWMQQHLLRSRLGVELTGPPSPLPPRGMKKQPWLLAQLFVLIWSNGTIAPIDFLKLQWNFQKTKFDVLIFVQCLRLQRIRNLLQFLAIMKANNG